MNCEHYFIRDLISRKYMVVTQFNINSWHVTEANFFLVEKDFSNEELETWIEDNLDVYIVYKS